MASNAESELTSSTRHPPRAPWGRRLYTFFVVLLTALSLTGMGLLTYVVFPPPPVDILILGVDTSSSDAPGRVDSALLMNIDPQKLQVSTLPILPAFFADHDIFQGLDTLQAGLARNFSVQVDRYILIDFETFTKLIDSVGGIQLDVARTLVDEAYPADSTEIMRVQFESGLQTMDGERALIYARTFHGDGVYARAGRHQDIAAALGRKTNDPASWPTIIAALSSSVGTNLTLWDTLTLAPPLLLSHGRFNQLAIERMTDRAQLDYAWIRAHFD